MRYLSSKPTVQGGDLVIKGARIPIEVILYRLKDGHWLQEIHVCIRRRPGQRSRGGIGAAIDLLAPRLHGKEVLQT